jgi:hypothetical protein
MKRHEDPGGPVSLLRLVCNLRKESLDEVEARRAGGCELDPPLG